MHGPMGTDRLDRLVAYGLWTIGRMLGAVKDGTDPDAFLPQWQPRTATTETPDVAFARLREAFGE